MRDRRRTRPHAFNDLLVVKITWMWGAETHLRSTMNWNFEEGIGPWLESQSFQFADDGKPTGPKEDKLYAGRILGSAGVQSSIGSASLDQPSQGPRRGQVTYRALQ